MNQQEQPSKVGGGDTALKSQRNNPPVVQTQNASSASPEKPPNEGKQASFQNTYSLRDSNKQGSNLNVRNAGKTYNRVSSLRKKGSRADNKDDEEDGFESD